MLRGRRPRALGRPSPANAAAPDTLTSGPWRLGSKAGLNVTQSTNTSNWSGGDRGALAWVLSADFTAERQFGRAYHASHRLALAYGQTSRQVPSSDDPGRLVWDQPTKSSDLIALEHTSRFTLGGFVDPHLGLQLESQFRDLGNPAGEIRFNPIKLKETAGLARVLQKTDKISFITRLGFGFRQTLGQGFVSPPAQEKESFFSNDGGFEWQTTMKRPLFRERVRYEGGLTVFAPVFYSKSGDLRAFDRRARDSLSTWGDVADDWKTPDVASVNEFTTHVTKLVTVNLLLHFVYDRFDTKANVDARLPLAVQIAEITRNVRKAGQFKQVLALGISYAFF